uniref:FERM domain-containing protein n=1 Tax=Angiostrongylus cantonensis TaxID=6313 RepID=A0A0K0DGE4_ANGCA
MELVVLQHSDVKVVMKYRPSEIDILSLCESFLTAAREQNRFATLSLSFIELRDLHRNTNFASEHVPSTTKRPLACGMRLLISIVVVFGLHH